MGIKYGCFLLMFFLGANLINARDLTDTYLKNKPQGNSLDKEQWEKLKDNYKYKSPKAKEDTKDKSKEKKSLSFNFGGVGWTNILFYLMIFLLLIFVIYWLLRSGILNKDPNQMKRQGFNIHENPDDINDLEIDPLLASALKEKDYRLSIRLRFLAMLQLLNRQKLITWERDKTNSAYLKQLSEPEVSRSFKQISLIYEKVWYGEYPMDASLYSTAAQKFDEFNNVIKRPLHV